MGLGHVFQLLVKILTNAHNATTTEPSLKMCEVLNFKDFLKSLMLSSQNLKLVQFN
jgi:hypothetical protein